MHEILSGTFNGLERLDLCTLNVLARCPAGGDLRPNP